MILFGKNKNKEKQGFENYRLYCRLRADPKVKDVLVIWEDIRDEQGAIIDSHMVEVMPVFMADTIESLIARYVRVFPEEIKMFSDEVKAEYAVIQEKGWSGGRTMRLAMKMPEKLYRCIELLVPGFFRPCDIRANMRRLRAVLPDIMTGSV